MPTPSPRLTIAGALAAAALILTGCASEAPDTAAPEAVETATFETATAETATPVAELSYPEQVEKAWLEGWGVADFTDIQQPDTDPPRFAAYITEIRSDAPGEITAVITPPSAPDPDALQRFATEEYRLIQNVGTVELNKLTVTTADGSVTVEGSTDDPYAF